MAISWRFKRKLFYLILVLIIPVFLLYRFVFLLTNKEPTCFDGKQNGTELGIDCGGGCNLFCTFQVTNLREKWERPFYVADDVYNLIAYLENLNTDAGVPEIFYEFKVFDEDNNIIGEPFIGKTFIGPGEKSVVFVPGFKTGNKQASSVSFRFISDLLWYKTDPFFATPFIKVKNRRLLDTETLPRLEVTLENTSFLDFYDLPVVVVLSDAEGNALGVSQTIIDFFPDTKELNIDFSWPSPFSGTVSEIEIIPRINPFSSYR